jgi:hypothetical protein
VVYVPLAVGGRAGSVVFRLLGKVPGLGDDHHLLHMRRARCEQRQRQQERVQKEKANLALDVLLVDQLSHDLAKEQL